MKTLRRICLLISLFLVLFAGTPAEVSAVGNTDLAPGYTNVTLAPYSAPTIPLNTPCNTSTSTSFDATTQIQTALTATGAAGGGIVYLPSGMYCIKTHLSIPSNVTLKGVFVTPPSKSTGCCPTVGTVLFAVEGAGSSTGTPFISESGPNSVVDGLSIYYQNQNPLTNTIGWTPTAFPYTIRGSFDSTIQNVMLVNSYQGIDLFTNQSGRHFVRGVYGEPLAVGIKVNQSLDVSRIEDVHFWPFWSTSDVGLLTWVQRNGVAFIFGRSDWELVNNVFAWGYSIGMGFQDLGQGTTAASMTNVVFDSVGTGIDLYDSNTLVVTNLLVWNSTDTSVPRKGIWNHANASSAALSIVNATIGGGTHQAVLWEQGGMLKLSNAKIQKVESPTASVAVVDGNAMVQDNAFEGALAGTADVYVGPAADRVIITGNMLFGGTITVSNSTTLQANNQP